MHLSFEYSQLIKATATPNAKLSLGLVVPTVYWLVNLYIMDVYERK